MKDDKKQTGYAWTPPTKPARLNKIHSKGVTLIELLVFLWLLVCGMFGFSRGVRFASQFGSGWVLLGAVVGFVLGMIAGLVLFFAVILVFESLGEFCKWWRPLLPVCENGCCSQKDYESAKSPLPVRKHVEGIPDCCYRCKCGYLYVQIESMAFNTKWVRLLSDHTIQPYLKHIPFGRWKVDKDDKTEIPQEDNQRNWNIDLCSTQTLRPYQEGLVPLFVIFIVLGPLIFFFLSWIIHVSFKESVFIFSTPFFIMLIGIYIVTCIEGNSNARIIEADSELIRVHRFGKQQIEIAWESIIFSRLKKELNSQRWIFKTADKKHVIASEGFTKGQWKLFSDYIQQKVSQDN